MFVSFFLNMADNLLLVHTLNTHYAHTYKTYIPHTHTHVFFLITI